MAAKLMTIQKDNCITIPKDMRKELDIAPKDNLFLFNEDKFIIVVKVPKKKEEAFGEVMNMATKKNHKLNKIMSTIASSICACENTHSKKKVRKK